MVELFKDGDNLAIVSDARDESEFIQQISEAFNQLIIRGHFENDWEFQLNFWLPQVADICCAYRGYKNSVTVRSRYITGEYYPLEANSLIVVGAPTKLEKIGGEH